MKNKKNVPSTEIDPELEQRIDTMMDPRRPDQNQVTASKTPVSPKQGPINIFEGLKTAPELPSPKKRTSHSTTLPSTTAEKPLKASGTAVVQPPKAPENRESPATPEPNSAKETPIPPLELPEQVAPDAELTAPAQDENIVIPEEGNDDPSISAAIDDIVIEESDKVLAAEDAGLFDQTSDEDPLDNDIPAAAETSKARLLTRKRRRVIGVVVLIAVLGAFVYPASRFTILGIVLKPTLRLQILDAATAAPISDVGVRDAGSTATTNASGVVSLHIPLGASTLQVSKPYYASVDIRLKAHLHTKQSRTVRLSATGRPVSLTVLNSITDAPIADARVQAVGTSVLTDNLGKATLEVPIGFTTAQATVSGTGYNPTQAALSSPPSSTASTNLTLTPSGTLYYLSPDGSVYSTNLDGSHPTLIVGPQNGSLTVTSLTASPDWKYLAIEAVASNNQLGVYVITTASGKVSEFDSGSLTIHPIGWYGDTFLYDETKNSLPSSSAGHEVIRSYNALTQQLNLLDTTQVSTTGNAYAYQAFSDFVLTPTKLAYAVIWHQSGSIILANQTDTVRAVTLSSNSKQDYLSLTASAVTSIAVDHAGLESIYYAVANPSNNLISYYSFSGSSITPTTGASASDFMNLPSRFFVSPNTEQTLWSSSSTPTPSLGDASANNPKPLMLAAGYSAFGWYGNSYLLLLKDNTLFITAPSTTEPPHQVGPVAAQNYAYAID